MPPRTLVFALIAVTALLVASWTAFLVWLSTHQLADAILRAGVAFASALGLGLAVWAAFREPPGGSADGGEPPVPTVRRSPA